MRTRLLLLTILAATLSCGGDAVPSVESGPPDLVVEASTWPDAADLGEVVSSGILLTDERPPPPDFER